MATKITVETWLKTEMTKDQANIERQERLNSGAVSSTLTEDDAGWILTTVWRVISANLSNLIL
jgi:hypothetical protein